jgi:chaperonin GroES
VARTVQPMGDRVLVKPMEERESTTLGGIILPDTVKEKPQEGEVMAVGPGRVGDDGKRIALEITKGDLVLYSKYGGTELKEEGTDLLLLSERDILAKIT